MNKTPVRGKAATPQQKIRTLKGEDTAAESSNPKELKRFVLTLQAEVFLEFSGEDLEGALEAGRAFIEEFTDLPFSFIVPSLGRPLEVMLADSEPELYEELDPGEDWSSPDKIEIPVGRDDGLEEGGVRHLTDSEREIVTAAWKLWNAQERAEALLGLVAKGDEMGRIEFRELAQQIVLLEVMQGPEISAMGLSQPFAPAGYRHRPIELPAALLDL